MSNIPHSNPKTGVNEQKNTECRGKRIYIELWRRTVVTAVKHFIRISDKKIYMYEYSERRKEENTK
jgi:hypothetical protein